MYNQFELLKAETEDHSSDEYLAGLSQLPKKYPSSEYNAYILFEIANFYLNKAANEDAKAFEKKKTATDKALSVLMALKMGAPTAM